MFDFVKKDIPEKHLILKQFTGEGNKIVPKKTNTHYSFLPIFCEGCLCLVIPFPEDNSRGEYSGSGSTIDV